MMIAGVTDKSIKVSYNKQLIKQNTFEQLLNYTL